jgi:hypothetical protein
VAIIPLPSGAEFDRLDWRPVASVQVNKGQWNASRRVLDLDNGYMAASVAIEVATEAEARAWRGFHARLRGALNTFRLPASECVQATGSINLAAGAAAGANSVSTAGWAGASALLAEGQYITINDQLLVLTADVPASGTNRTLSFEPPLRAAAGNGVPVEIANPTGLVFIPGGEAPQTVNGVTTWSFEAEEAF